MLDSAEKMIALMGEPTVLLRRGRAFYANSAARAVLGEDCAGKRVSELFGDLVAGVQAPSFLAQIRLGDRPFLLRVASLDGDKIVSLRPQEELPAVLNQAFLFSLRGCLMNLELAAGRMRVRAESLQDDALLDGLCAVTRSQYQLRRMIGNAALILGVSDGSVVASPQVFNLSELCASVLGALEPLFPDIRFLLRSPGTVTVRADLQLVKELLLNLLSNAIRHGQGCSQISVSLLPAERSVVLAVDDNGCGIPAEELPLVFDRYRHAYDLRQMGAGAGLGLTAVRLIAQLHGGTLLLESRAGAGTTLRVSLSRETPEQLRADRPEVSLCQTGDLLTGLADCLPYACFREQYLD